ncbi:hypothetical protein PsYK624_172080 [Phanerochaete sordida]|uniref:Uncharacterized protein n=1 Tax=Phanerochaete sordida TaxID=48140 RepID=A0A9P3LMJ0_9APHY|nr:hypothetical protein PsYK624_172080 [Phanerochaete sordida]
MAGPTFPGFQSPDEALAGTERSPTPTRTKARRDRWHDVRLHLDAATPAASKPPQAAPQARVQPGKDEDQVRHAPSAAAGTTCDCTPVQPCSRQVRRRKRSRHADTGTREHAVRGEGEAQPRTDEAPAMHERRPGRAQTKPKPRANATRARRGRRPSAIAGTTWNCTLMQPRSRQVHRRKRSRPAGTRTRQHAPRTVEAPAAYEGSPSAGAGTTCNCTSVQPRPR